MVVLCCVLIAILAGSSKAQPLSPSRGFDINTIEQSAAKQRLDKDRKRPEVALPSTAAGSGNNADKAPILKLRDVAIVGAIVVAPSVLAESYQHLIGTMVSQADLVEITTKISQVYRDQGYFLSRAIIPPQDISAGIVKIQVIEGRIDEIVVKGDERGRFGAAKMLAGLSRSGLATLSAVERKLMLLNGVNGLRVTDTSLEEIGEASGRFRLIVTVETWRILSSQGIENSGSAAVGPWQAYGTASVNSTIFAGDTADLGLSTTPLAPDQLLFGRLSYEAPLGQDGVRIGGTVTSSNVAPGDARRNVNTQTQTQSVELRGSFVPYQTRRTSVTITAAIGATDATERDVISTNYDDHIRTVSLAGDLKFQDDFGGWNAGSITLKQGLSVLGGTQAGDPLVSRGGASSTFSLMGLSLARLQKINDIWSVKLSGNAQFASTPLLLSQQFYLGSAGLGPGYFSGDNGLSGQAELRFDQTVDAKWLRGYQLYSFIDGGMVWNANSAGSSSLSSVGLGARLFLAGQLQAGVAVATPIVGGPSPDQARPIRVLFSLTNSFKLCPERRNMKCL